ncbi:zinc transporter ZIP3-like isoform X2 [Harmonia axyridis]|uniref:zinc transporter ZIP3-like isoform X2 n=1 Tax=Harmonia axyridis TaxID=115357 RepID=UPI001E2763AE|nr:zinc transporter ZIP3-like isoform X2 [Harmonia axyridis]
MCEGIASVFERYGFYNAIFHSFGAGVMLCTCLIHLVTSVHSAISNEIEGDVAASSQYSQFLICSGFFMIYFLEELGQWIIAKVPAKPFVSNPEYSASVGSRSETVITSISNHLECCQKSKPIEITQTIDVEMSSDSKTAIVVIDAKNFVRFLFTEVAVGVHAFFEGLAIGLQCQVLNIAYLSIGMTIHSITTLTCLGFNFIIARTPRRIILGHYAVLALTTPLGVIVGMLVNLADLNFQEREKINAFMEALSAGNILYITFFEVLSKEKKKQCNKFFRNLSMLIGFSLMCYLEYYQFRDAHKFKKDKVINHTNGIS